MTRKHAFKIKFSSNIRASQFGGALLAEKFIRRQLRSISGTTCRSDAWSDRDIVLLLLLQLLSGYDNIKQSSHFLKDPGVQQMVKSWGYKHVPSLRTMYRAFLRLEKNDILAAHQNIIQSSQQNHPSKVATLDQDATIVSSKQASAAWTYKSGIKGYQPSLVYWAEQDVVLHSDYRAGNVPACYNILEQLQTAVAQLPKGIETTRVRMDGAGYQRKIIKWLVSQGVEFSISGQLSDMLRDEMRMLPDTSWQPCYDDDGLLLNYEVAKLMMTPEWMPEGVLIIAKRVVCRDTHQLEFEKLVHRTKKLQMNGHQYDVQLMVSNRHDLKIECLVKWALQRCGAGERIHSELKQGLAGNTTPSSQLSLNEKWWNINILAYNLLSLMKKAWGRPWFNKTVKTVRLMWFNTVVRIVRHANNTYLVCHHVMRSFYELNYALCPT